MGYGTRTPAHVQGANTKPYRLDEPMQAVARMNGHRRFLQRPGQLPASALVNIAEADASCFPQSSKGGRGLLRDRAGVTINLIVPGTTVVHLGPELRPMLSVGSIPCTDGSRPLAAAVREPGVRHQEVNLGAGVRVNGARHVQYVNTWVSRLRGWNLASWPGWFRGHDAVLDSRPGPASILALAITE